MTRVNFKTKENSGQISLLYSYNYQASLSFIFQNLRVFIAIVIINKKRLFLFYSLNRS